MLQFTKAELKQVLVAALGSFVQGKDRERVVTYVDSFIENHEPIAEQLKAKPTEEKPVYPGK